MRGTLLALALVATTTMAASPAVAEPTSTAPLAAEPVPPPPVASPPAGQPPAPEPAASPPAPPPVAAEQQPSEAAPPVKPEEKGLWDSAPATWRSGFTAGVLVGLSFGSVHGYPNDFAKIDVPAYRAATSGAGPGFVVYLGGALTDWFTFGFGLGSSSVKGSDLVSRATVYLFHLEAFPGFGRGGRWRDLGLFADFGTGTATIQRQSDKLEYASGGALSIVGIGAFFELWRAAGHLAFGPYASWHYESSDSMTRHAAEIGLRGSFYGGP